ncbi:MAG: hypothetical protein HND49_16650 [Planctomycetes bacterium]|nr:hypothetical protein [Planctomycetota bacterium]
MNLYVNNILMEEGKTPCLTARELEELGFKLGVFALSGLFAATKAIEECFRFPDP